MKTYRRIPVVTWFLLVAGVGALGYSIGRARAAGIPTPPSLTYAGTLTNALGEELNDTHNIQIQFWGAATGGTTPLCLTQPVATELQRGRFTIALPQECSTAVKANPDLWVEILVDGSALNRTKIGVTPYAIEAAHASEAAHAVTANQAADFQISGNLEVASGSTFRGPLIRTLARAHGLGPADDTDSGSIASRTLTFTKTRADTAVRVTWTDNLRVTNTGDTCRWEIKFGDASCSNPGPLIYDLYFGGVAGMNLHRPDTVVGTCLGLGAGTYAIHITVGPVTDSSQGDCYTGWRSQYWAIEAEEVY